MACILAGLTAREVSLAPACQTSKLLQQAVDVNQVLPAGGALFAP